MAIYLKRYGFAVTKYDARDTGISGSSRFANILSWFDTELKPKNRLFNTASERPIRAIVERTDADGHSGAGVGEKRKFGVDRKKLLDRLNAYVCLSRSMKFLAFYSISFPMGMPDEVVRKLWNSCLTSLREKSALKSYIWVMERQRNGTMHFHMLTNDYMPVRGVNHIVANCIQYYVDKGFCSWGNSSMLSYNGVDVENISKRISRASKRHQSQVYNRVVAYVTKYMSKNSAYESGRQWHCSRLVSALFVTAYLCPTEVDILFEGQEDLLRDRKIVESEHGSVILFDAICSSAWADTIGYWNDKIYELFERESLW